MWRAETQPGRFFHGSYAAEKGNGGVCWLPQAAIRNRAANRFDTHHIGLQRMRLRW
jgi:hypothetical protein